MKFILRLVDLKSDNAVICAPQICDILIMELGVTSYELFLLHELRVTFCIRVMNYSLLHELRATFYIRVTSYCLFHKLRVTFIARVTSYCLLHELRVTVYCKS